MCAFYGSYMELVSCRRSTQPFIACETFSRHWRHLPGGWTNHMTVYCHVTIICAINRYTSIIQCLFGDTATPSCHISLLQFIVLLLLISTLCNILRTCRYSFKGVAVLFRGRIHFLNAAGSGAGSHLAPLVDHVTISCMRARYHSL